MLRRFRFRATGTPASSDVASGGGHAQVRLPKCFYCWPSRAHAHVAQGALTPSNHRPHAQAGAGAGGCADPAANGPVAGAARAFIRSGKVRVIGLRLPWAQSMRCHFASRLVVHGVSAAGSLP